MSVAEKKMSRKELKAPDAFQKAGFEAREWLQTRQRQVGAAIVLAVLLGAGVALASYVSSRGEEQASKELGAALKILERPVVEEASAEPPGEGKEPPFKSAHERDEAVEKALIEFRSARSGTHAAQTAALTLGQAQYRLGKFDASLASLGDFLKAAPKENILRAEALEGQGYDYEGKGELDQALAAFEQLARENKTEFLNGVGSYQRARILVLQGKKEEAAKAFSEVTTAFPATAAARMATERLNQLAAQGVKIPAPAPAAATVDAG